MKTEILLLFLVVFSIISCKKDEDQPEAKVYPEENPLSEYLKKSEFDQKTFTAINFPNDYELGYSFIPKVKGKINAITFKIPDNAINVRVTIWDVATKTVQRTIIIPTVSANVEVKQSIDPLLVELSKEYAVSFNGNDFYSRRRTDNTETTYPIDAGNIFITGYRELITPDQTFPLNIYKSVYNGDVSIVFQQTE